MLCLLQSILKCPLSVEQGQGMDTSMGLDFEIPHIWYIECDIFGTYIWSCDSASCKALHRAWTWCHTASMNGDRSCHLHSFHGCNSLVEIKRLQLPKEHDLLDPIQDTPAVPINIFWQVPQYFLVGMAEIFTFIGQSEFFYDQAPDAMRSLCSALPLTTVALGNYLSSLLVTVISRITNNVNIGHIDCF